MGLLRAAYFGLLTEAAEVLGNIISGGIQVFCQAAQAAIFLFQKPRIISHIREYQTKINEATQADRSRRKVRYLMARPTLQPLD
jgi:hypothetical protein